MCAFCGDDCEYTTSLEPRKAPIGDLTYQSLGAFQNVIDSIDGVKYPTFALEMRGSTRTSLRTFHSPGLYQRGLSWNLLDITVQLD